MNCLVSIKNAAEQLSCSEAALRKWLHTGRLSRVKVGRLTRIRKEDIDAVMRVGLTTVVPQILIRRASRAETEHAECGQDNQAGGSRNERQGLGGLVP